MARKQLNHTIQYMMNTGLFHDEEQALLILKASLKALRNRLPKVEAFHLSSHLPDSLRDSYFEGWHNGQRRAESVNKSEFLAEVELYLNGYEDHSLTDLVPVAMKSILNMVSENEAEIVKHALPVSMRDIFIDRQSMD